VKIVSVSGAVKAPGEYPLEQGDRVFDLIRAAGGLRDSAYLPSIEFRRVTAQSDGSVEPIYQELSLEHLADLTDANNLVLSSRDHLTIRDIPDWSPNQSVEIAGEVRFPGTYLIRQGETLTELIERAGGLKPNAFARGAVFTRESVAAQEADRAEEFATSIKNSFASSLLTQEIKSSDLADIESIANLLQGFKGKGRLLIDLEQALAGNAGANIALLDGDRLEVPELNKTVTIVGEVRRQGTHTLQQGYDLDDYLGLSAGLTARADKDYMYIVRADGSVTVPTKSSWRRFDTAGQKLLAGDTIVVPINITYKDEISQWRDITQIIYQSAIAVAAVVAL
ncbi:MAG: SLBB domain-containing protein, partial [Pseudomonadales bacterium]|nr:SLBB domain-containing protein [Pseudomonadales bacterium]